LEFIQKIRTDLPFDSAISLLAIYAKMLQSAYERNTKNHLVIVTYFTSQQLDRVRKRVICRKLIIIKTRKMASCQLGNGCVIQEQITGEISQVLKRGIIHNLHHMQKI
jgi:hypothetical protein